MMNAIDDDADDDRDDANAVHVDTALARARWQSSFASKNASGYAVLSDRLFWLGYFIKRASAV